VPRFGNPEQVALRRIWYKSCAVTWDGDGLTGLPHRNHVRRPFEGWHVTALSTASSCAVSRGAPSPRRRVASQFEFPKGVESGPCLIGLPMARLRR
jgi:hypothetical protein